MKVQIIHERDADYDCSITVFIDGVRQDNVEVIDIDPGKGYDDETIREMRHHAEAKAHAPDATDFDTSVADAYAEARFERWSV